MTHIDYQLPLNPTGRKTQELTPAGTIQEAKPPTASQRGDLANNHGMEVAGDGPNRESVPPDFREILIVFAINGIGLVIRRSEGSLSCDNCHTPLF